MENSENANHNLTLKGIFKRKQFWVVIVALIAIILLIILTDWNGFTDGFNRGFNSIE